MPRQIHYDVLDVLNDLRKVSEGTAKEISKFLDITEWSVAPLCNNKTRVFDRYNIVIQQNEEIEEEEEEEWNLFKETDTTLYYVSNQGHAKKVDTQSLKQEAIDIVHLKNHKEAVIKVEGKFYYLKTLVCKYHQSRKYKAGAMINCIDGNENNCDVSNLAVIC